MRLSTRLLPLHALQVLAIPGLLGCSLAVSAGDWKLTDSLSTQLVLSDNIGRDEDAEAGMRVVVRPRLTLRGTGARVKGGVAFSPSFSQEIGGDNDSDLSLSMNANADTELYRDTLFVNARAAAGLVSESGLFNVGADEGGAGRRDDLRQTYTFSISPEIRNRLRLGKYADVTPRLNFDTVQSAGDAPGRNSSSYGATLTISSGRFFTTFPWYVSFAHSETSYEDRDDSSSSVTAQVHQRWTNRWLTRVNVGYEENDVATSREDTDGPFWSVGGVWTPNPRTKVDLRYGERYFGPDWQIDFSHRSRRTRLSGSVQRTLTNVREELLEGLFLPPLEPGEVPSIDPNLNLPSLRSEDYITTSFRLGIAATGLRTTLGLNLGLSQRDYEVSGDSQDTYTARLSASRRMGAQLTGRASVTWQQTEASDGDDSETYQFTVGASRPLGRESSVGLDFSHYQRDEEVGDSVTENRVTATFSTSFL